MKVQNFLVILIFLSVSCSKNTPDNHPNSPNPCFDGVKNNGETGVDCGGPCTACPKEWTAVTSGTTADLYSVIFFDESNGWASGSGGTIIHTTDGGNTWSAQTSGITDTLNSISFVNSLTGYIAGTGHILKTTNGGINWSIVTTATASQSFYTILFNNASNGWVGGTDGDYPFIDNTSTGGVLWSNRYTGQPTNQHGSIRSLDFATAYNGFAVGTEANGLSLQTADAGNTWSPLNLQAPALLYACDFSSQTDGWATGNHNYYFATATDLWRTQTHLPDAVTLRGIKLVTTGQGWAVGNSGTVYKRSGQYEWTTVPNIATSNNLYSVWADGTNGCIVGQSGTIYILK